MTRQRASVAIAIVIIAVFTAAIQPAFLSVDNLLNIVVQATIPGIVALGMTYVIIAGGIDLSVGSIVALASIVLGVFAQAGVPPLVATGVCLLMGMGVGLVNGILVNRVGLAPFLATLGTMGIARGGAFLWSGGEPISGVTGSLRVLYNMQGWALPVSVFVLAGLVAMGAILLELTVWGRRLYAIGSNEHAARLVGIDVKGYRIATYVIAGFAAALGGAFVTARLDSAQPLAGSLYELDAIAAVVIGGGSLTGGRGDIVGTMLGVLLVLELRNAVTVVGLPTHAQPLVIGVLLLVAVTVDVWQHKSNLSERVT